MKYRKKPIEVEAFRIKFTKILDGNSIAFYPKDYPEWLLSYFKTKKIFFQICEYGRFLKIETLEGTMKAFEGDWIIKGVYDEIYPCKSHIFETTYEEVIL